MKKLILFIVIIFLLSGCEKSTERRCGVIVEKSHPNPRNNYWVTVDYGNYTEQEWVDVILYSVIKIGDKFCKCENQPYGL